HDEVEVAGAAVGAGAALAGNAHPRPFADPRRNLHGETLALLDRARSAARRTRPPSLAAGATARFAGRRPADGDRLLRAAQGLGEVDLERVLEIAGDGRARRLLLLGPTSAATEQVVQDVGEATLVGGRVFAAPAPARRPEAEVVLEAAATARTLPGTEGE